MIRSSIFVITVLLFLASIAHAKLLFRVADGDLLSAEEFLAEIKSSQVIFIGENHNDALHKSAQLELVRLLHEAGEEVAIAMEMFRTDAQPSLDRWTAGTSDKQEFLELYLANWDRRYWGLYSGLFYYARDHAIPIVGLNVSRSIVRKVARGGYETLTNEEREQLGVLTCNISKRYEETMRAATGGLTANGETFNRFCQAQLVWDTAMAQNTAKYANDNPGKKVVVVAGALHAWKHGIPEQLSRTEDIPHKVIMPSHDDSFFNYKVLLEDADYVWWFGDDD